MIERTSVGQSLLFKTGYRYQDDYFQGLVARVLKNILLKIYYWAISKTTSFFCKLISF